MLMIIIACSHPCYEVRSFMMIETCIDWVGVFFSQSACLFYTDMFLEYEYPRVTIIIMRGYLFSTLFLVICFSLLSE